MSRFARNAWRELEDAGRRIGAEAPVAIHAVLRAHRDASGVRVPVEAEDVQAAARELLVKVEAWLRGSAAARAALRAPIGLAAEVVGEGLDAARPRPRFRRDIDDAD